MRRPGPVDGTVSAHQELIGRPGVMTSYEIFHPTKGRIPAYDVCCPGCGEKVYALRDFPLAGAGPLGMSQVQRKSHRWPCCGWTGWLRNGVWVFDLKALPAYLLRSYRRNAAS